MSITIPERASAVVIGGGVIGSSVAYHLAKLGWSDVVQLERNQFSCGTTWHAAGLVGTMRANESQARLCEYSMAVLSELEAETGQSTGFKQVGSLTIAHSAARFEELKRVAAMNNAFGVTRVDMVTPEEIKTLYPYLETSDLLGLGCPGWYRESGRRHPGIRQGCAQSWRPMYRRCACHRHHPGQWSGHRGDYRPGRNSGRLRGQLWWFVGT